MAALLLQLFCTFFVIGLVNFGGGNAMLSLIQAQVVSVHGWISEGMFTDIVAISQTTPGPIGINCATYVGYQVVYDAGYGCLAGAAGSALATLAVVMPSFIVFYSLVKVIDKVQGSPVYAGTMTALRPCVAGLIGAAALVLMFRVSLSGGISFGILESNFPDWKAWLLFAAAFSISYFRKTNPILLIVLAGAAGLIIY